MNALGYALLAGLIAYLLGSVSFAVIVSKVFRLADPRTYGSKNPGATNVLRSGNKVAAFVTLLGDGFKGWLAVWLTLYFSPRFGFGDQTLAVVALAVFLGHLWPLYFKFVGGKGVATFFGVMLGLNALWLGLPCLLTWLVVAFLSRYSSLAALVAAAAAPAYLALFDEHLNYTDSIMLAVGVMALLLFYRHRQNIGKLLAGKESKIGSKAKKT
jgi:acyl phosphate:glycerol-3-phosphate acyltransferase